MAGVSKKRKSTALNDDGKAAKKSKKAGATSASEANGVLSPVSPAATEEEAENGDSSNLVPQDEEMQFKVECPAHPSSSSKKRRGKVDRFGPHWEHNDEYPKLKVQYAVIPGAEWSGMRIFRNFIAFLSSVGEHKFSTGEHVFINHRRNLPPPSSADDVAFDRENNWIAKVLEVRAVDPQHVYLRVFWLYWPEELPGGRQAHHGDSEVVMSNHMEIVDAMTVAGKVDVSHWREEDGEEELAQLYWRQTYNVQGNGKLSEPRRHCICEDHYNPDTTLLKCPDPQCGIWLHENCLIEDILAKTYSEHVENATVVSSKEAGTDQGVITVDTNANKKSAKKPLFPMSKLAELGSNAKQKLGLTGGKKGAKSGNAGGKKNASASKERPWEGKFRATIRQNGGEGEIEEEERGEEEKAKEKGKGKKGLEVKLGVFEITDERAQDPETWEEKIRCLKCGTALD
ncbi:MAG: hypothetical protein Q9227_002456 [Pyrenula ochraceoflavens]